MRPSGLARGMKPDDPRRGFARLGPATPASPVILSVPHAGRDYPDSMATMLRLPVERLAPLEDRHVDLLVGDAVRAGVAALVARLPRAWIDLNRRENELDATMVVPRPPLSALTQSAKVRGGLGLVPRRIAGAGEIWRGAIAADEIARRIAEDYRPYHEALGRLLAEARARFGVAVLLDLHSMPPIPGESGGPRIVIGDRFGQTAGSRFLSRLAAEAEAAGLASAENSPYAGGHILERHGAPDRGVHAIQLEIDRSLYLEADLLTPRADGVAAMARFVAQAAAALADEALAGPQSLAAE